MLLLSIFPLLLWTRFLMTEKSSVWLTYLFNRRTDFHFKTEFGGGCLQRELRVAQPIARWFVIAPLPASHSGLPAAFLIRTPGYLRLLKLCNNMLIFCKQHSSAAGYYIAKAEFNWWKRLKRRLSWIFTKRHVHASLLDRQALFSCIASKGAGSSRAFEAVAREWGASYPFYEFIVTPGSGFMLETASYFFD